MEPNYAKSTTDTRATIKRTAQAVSFRSLIADGRRLSMHRDDFEPDCVCGTLRVGCGQRQHSRPARCVHSSLATDLRCRTGDCQGQSSAMARKFDNNLGPQGWTGCDNQRHSIQNSLSPLPPIRSMTGSVAIQQGEPLSRKPHSNLWPGRVADVTRSNREMTNGTPRLPIIEACAAAWAVSTWIRRHAM